jgi:hypothetical protein
MPSVAREVMSTAIVATLAVILPAVMISTASAATTVQAESAAAFLNSIGVNTHLGETGPGTGYHDTAVVGNELRNTGIMHIRDSLFIGAGLNRMRGINSRLGVTFDLVYDNYATTATTAGLEAAIANVGSASSLVEAIEGANEPDYFGVYYNGLSGGAAAASIQRDLWSVVKANPNLKATPVYCTALSYPGPGGMIAALGNLAPWCDFSNSHDYVANLTLGAYLPWDYLRVWTALPLASEAPGRPRVITEGGWSTQANASDGVDETTQAKYLMEYLLDAFSQGITRTYIYELADDAADPALTNNQLHYGLYHADGTPKPAATMLANLNAMLRDVGFTPGTFTYTLTGMPGNALRLPLAKSDGTFVLVLWQEATLWNAATHGEVSGPSSWVLLSLAAPASSVRIFDPLLGASPRLAYSDVQNVAVNIPDHPVFVFIKP